MKISGIFFFLPCHCQSPFHLFSSSRLCWVADVFFFLFVQRQNYHQQPSYIDLSDTEPVNIFKPKMTRKGRNLMALAECQWIRPNRTNVSFFFFAWGYQPSIDLRCRRPTCKNSRLDAGKLRGAISPSTEAQSKTPRSIDRFSFWCFKSWTEHEGHWYFLFSFNFACLVNIKTVSNCFLFLKKKL